MIGRVYQHSTADTLIIILSYFIEAGTITQSPPDITFHYHQHSPNNIVYFGANLRNVSGEVSIISVL
jgi:hypothetical protein